MRLILQLLKSFGYWLLALLAVIFVALIPRDKEVFMKVPLHYEISLEEYKYNIFQFFYHLWTEGSIGNNRYGTPVEGDILAYFPKSMIPFVIAFVISACIGLLKGIYDYKGTLDQKYMRQGSTWFLLAVPDYLLILIIHLSVFLLWRAELLPAFNLFGSEMWYNYVIITVLLCIYPTLYIARITSATLATQEDLHYIRTAKAKGLFQNVILYKHILGNCWAAIFSHLPTLVLFMFSNLLMVEYLMLFHGAADRLYKALGFHWTDAGYLAPIYEPYVVIAFSLCFMLVVLFAQIISQVSRYMLDPRVREEDHA